MDGAAALQDSDCLGEMVERLSAEGLGRQRHTANARLRSLVQRRAARLLSQINKRIDELSAEWRRRGERLVECFKQECAIELQQGVTAGSIEKRLAEFTARTVEALPRALAMFSPSLAEAITMLKQREHFAEIRPHMLPSSTSGRGGAALSSGSMGKEPNWRMGFVFFPPNGPLEEKIYYFMGLEEWVIATEAQWKLVGELQLLQGKKAALTAT